MKKDYYNSALAADGLDSYCGGSQDALWQPNKFDLVAMKTSKTVLTVDDDSSVRQLIRMALRSLKHVKVIEAENGLEGLNAVQKHQPDLVILDVMMPKLDGIGTLEKIRSNPDMAGTPVILLTGVKDSTKLIHVLENGSTDYLPKPFIIEILRQKVTSILYPSPMN